MGSNNYKQSARIYGSLCVLLALVCALLFIMILNKNNKSKLEHKSCADRYDSLYVVYRTNADNWEKFQKKSNGYYFVNPSEKRLINKFDLKTFVIE